MGNKNSANGEPTSLSTGTSPPVSNYNPSSTHNEETSENPYVHRPMPALPHRTSPSFPKRTYSVLEKKVTDAYGASTVLPSSSGSSIMNPPQAPLFRSGSIPVRPTPITPSVVTPLPTTTKTETPSFDDVSDHVTTIPKSGADEVSLGTTICVQFDKEVKTVNVNKLFEVTCESPDGESFTVKGNVSFDSRQMKAEFTPLKTLYPNSKITTRLSGKSITTSHCSQSINIKDMFLTFHTANPAPKTVGIKLKDQANTEQLQIANYYDLFNSLINWSSRKWGCSGEHVTGLYSEREGGKLIPLKVDLDILNIKDEEIIVIEIKD